jgi:hypothetical protein
MGIRLYKKKKNVIGTIQVLAREVRDLILVGNHCSSSDSNKYTLDAVELGIGEDMTRVWELFRGADALC